MPVGELRLYDVQVHEVTLQNLISVLDFHMEPSVAIDQPHYYGPSYEVTAAGGTRLELEKETVLEGAFSEELLNGVRSRGQAIKTIKGDPPMVGTWIGNGLTRTAANEEAVFRRGGVRTWRATRSTSRCPVPVGTVSPSLRSPG